MKKIRANIYWENFQLIDMVSIQWKKLFLPDLFTLQGL